MYNDAFVYLLFSLWFRSFFSWRGRGVTAGRTGREGFGVVLVYMCYSCSNIEVVSIHIHAFRKACSVHGSLVSTVTDICGDHVEGYMITLAHPVCVCVYRMPFTQEALLVMILSTTSLGGPSSVLVPESFSACSDPVSSPALARCHQRGTAFDCEEK